MIEKRYIELMNREIDGVATPGEIADLRTYLNCNTEARARYDELRGVAAAFERAGSVEPPANLEEIIIGTVTEREALCEERESAASRFFAMLTPRRKLAYTFAAGVACGLIILGLILTAAPTTGKLEIKDLYGSLTGAERGSAVLSKVRLPISAGAVSGSIEALYRERSITLEVVIHSPAEIATTIAPTGALPVEGFGAPSGGAAAVLADEAGVTLRSTGACRFFVTFKDEAGSHPAVDIVIRSNGEMVFGQRISGGRK